MCFLLLLLFCFFLSSTELHEVNNYDTNLSTEANASTPRYGPVPYFVVIGTNQHGIASGEKSFFFLLREGRLSFPFIFISYGQLMLQILLV